MTRDYDPDDLVESTDPADLHTWLEEITDAIEEGFWEPSSWEVDFLDNVQAALADWVESDDSPMPLTGKQLVSLRQIYDKVSE